jgi:hypothetical protein
MVEADGLELDQFRAAAWPKQTTRVRSSPIVLADTKSGPAGRPNIQSVYTQPNSRPILGQL